MSMNFQDLSPIRVKILRSNTTLIKRAAWPQLDGTSTEVSGSPSSVTAGEAHSSDAEPHIEVHPVSQDTDQIIVTCSCGKRIEVLCQSQKK